jgi:hypothetical protein
MSASNKASTSMMKQTHTHPTWYHWPVTGITVVKSRHSR